MTKSILCVGLLFGAAVCGTKFALATPAPPADDCDLACSDVYLAVDCNTTTACLLFTLPDCSTCKGNGYCRYRAPVPNPPNNICSPDLIVTTVSIDIVDCDELCLCGTTDYAEGQNWSNLGQRRSGLRHDTCPFNTIQPVEPP